MQKIILIVLMTFMLSGCSLVKTITAPFKSVQNTLPQETDKSKSKVVCKGEYKVDESGNIIYCSKGYYNYGENFKEKERRLTLKEKIIQFFDQLAGHLFWVFVILIIFFPSAIGWIVGRVFNSANSALSQTIKAIKKFRKESEPDYKERLDNYLRAEQDDKTKELIAKERTKI